MGLFHMCVCVYLVCHICLWKYFLELKVQETVKCTTWVQESELHFSGGAVTFLTTKPCLQQGLLHPALLSLLLTTNVPKVTVTQGVF